MDKAIGLMPYNKESDIIGKVLDSLTWLDHIVLLNWKQKFSERGIADDLIKFAKGYDWIVNLDADEVFLDLIDFSNIPDRYDIITVDIYYVFPHNDKYYYRKHDNWLRIFRNKPELFTFDNLADFHRGRICYRSDKIYHSNCRVKHYQLRTIEQAKAKYDFYMANDKTGFQKYDYMLEVIKALETGDFSAFDFKKIEGE